MMSEMSEMSESCAEGVEMISGGGAGDASALPPALKKNVGLPENDPDLIVSLGEEEEIPLGNKTRPVYRTCSVDASGAGLPFERQQNGNGPRGNQEEIPRNRNKGSAWSITKLFREHLCFKCCNKADEDGAQGESGIELENLGLDRVELKEPGNVDELDGVASETALITNDMKDARVTCSMGPVMTVDCSKSSIDDQLDHLKASLGDVIRKLIIRNPPIRSAMKIFNEPLLTENVTSVHIENCDVSVRDICMILGSLKRMEQLSIKLKNLPDSPLLQDDFTNSRPNTKDYFRSQREELFPSTEALPQGLKMLTISAPTIWQCSLICGTVAAMINDSHLEEINIKSSLTEVITQLVSTAVVQLEDDTTWQDFVTLVDARDLIQKSSSSLKHLTVACADTFPMEYLKIPKTTEVSIDEVYKWSFFCTGGVLCSIVPLEGDADANKNSSLLLPNLTNLNLDLPFLPIPTTRDDELRKPLNAVAEFLARNNGIHVVALYGLRPCQGMENWIRNSLVTIPKFKMSIGCTYTSTTLASNMPTFDDELGSLGLEIVADETKQSVAEIIDPKGKELIPHSWRYTGLKCFHLVNQLSSLMSYDLDRIVAKFSKLTKLTIEDFKSVPVPHGPRVLGNDDPVRTLTDVDMQTIFRKLVCLEYLHLDCNMKSVTDRGLTGITDSLWSRLTQRDKQYSFWYLYSKLA